ncbi:methyltransferase [Massilia antarctica]|uniref:methyltransferase n=1 Tax=Massilia antarctica TaxID=2765360 RepID=UPI0006BB5A23|nr:methyltransferase [Massilia sp. H27-R4]MCY0915003.1 methyltransferase domain-containing protein [Massilia sp. H27-R4]CUI06971.1 SAM-dependent methyltransferases [Janthinobacterium sp. CG23_2]CUU30757.1 SAM-dependent methyltransferases [Janthinobacterium sp. CG23_2]
MADFASRDPKSPAFWDERFERGFTPWDRGGVPAALRDFVSRSGRPLRTLIPGCGAAYELAYLSDAGWDATAIDFSPAAVAAARAAVGPWSERVREADFFAFAPTLPVDLMYERAFLCALPRAMWPQVAARWADLLAPGALLAGFFFFDDAPKGPPFGIARDQLDALLTPAFRCVEDAAVEDSIAVFAGKERWMVWQRS